ncbi:M13 family metallopeptidase [Silanimonas sp.]|jgi:putative endopeptidase|uniref:M13 family metallopeptidase n=1 Tax=Silanimonas sp. TaxID=1929290 RepID=UPI0037CAB844
MRTLALTAALAVAVLALSPAAAQNRGTRTPAAPLACADFNGHANHAWRLANPASAAQPERSRLAELGAGAAQKQAALLAAAATSPRNDQEKTLGAFWAAGMDEAGLERQSAAAVQTLLAPLAQLRRPRDLAKVGAAYHALGVAPMAEFVRLEATDGGRRPLAAVPAALGLIDPAFYTTNDAEVRTLLGKYRTYVEAVLRASGLPDAEISPASEAVLQIETQLAQALVGEGPEARSSDTLRAQDRRFIALGFADLLKQLGARSEDLVVVSPAYFATLGQIASTERDTKRLQWYLRFRVLNRFAPELGSTFRSAHGGFFAQILRGMPAAPSRAEHMDTLLRRTLGGLNDAAFNARYAPEARRQRALALAEGVRAAALEMVGKAGATEDAQRLQAMRFDIADNGSTTFDATGLEFRANDHVGNLLRYGRWSEGRILADRPLAIDPLPARVPAVQWLTGTDTLAITAAALSPPLLGEAGTAPDAADHGALGALIGHELAKRLTPGNRGAALGPLYNGFQAAPGLRVDGARTLPMNRADLAGLEFAWAAFTKAQPQADANTKKAFFTAWANLWAKTQTTEALRAEVQTSPYAPAAFRVNGPLSQLPAFGETYGCRVGAVMRAANPIGVWR